MRGKEVYGARIRVSRGSNAGNNDRAIGRQRDGVRAVEARGEEGAEVVWVEDLRVEEDWLETQQMTDHRTGIPARPNVSDCRSTRLRAQWSVIWTSGPCHTCASAAFQHLRGRWRRSAGLAGALETLRRSESPAR